MINRILFLTAFNPSKNDAGSNYTRQLLLELGESHIIDLIIFKKKDVETFDPRMRNISIIKAVKVSTFSRLKGFLMVPFIFPLFSSRFDYNILVFIKNKKKEVRYDIIYFDFSQTFLYSLFITHPRKVFMSHDVIFQRYERRNSISAFWAGISESWLLKTATKIFTFSKKDSDIIKNKYGLNSTPTTFFIQKEAIEAKAMINGNYFVFYGNWQRPENYKSLKWFIDEVYPKLPKDLFFKILGYKLPDELSAMIQHFENIEYLGFIDNPYQILANARALITPLSKGAGVKVKVIESFACGTPVIGSEISFEGIDNKYYEFMIKAKTPDDYRDSIECVSKTINEKHNFKKLFIKSYINKPVLEYLNK